MSFSTVHTLWLGMERIIHRWCVVSLIEIRDGVLVARREAIACTLLSERLLTHSSCIIRLPNVLLERNGGWKIEIRCSDASWVRNVAGSFLVAHTITITIILLWSW